MDEREYHERADAAISHLQAQLDALDADYELGSGGEMEIEFDDGSMIVVNKQSAAQEIWVAAKSGGFHYRWDGAAWRDTRSNEELFEALSRLITIQSGDVVRLATI